jgi:hypothetical protein
MVHFPGSTNAAHRLPRSSRSHSVILNYNTIARASLFLEKIFHVNLVAFDCKSLVEEKVGDREVAIADTTPAAPVHPAYLITPSGNGREVWLNARAVQAPPVCSANFTNVNNA